MKNCLLTAAWAVSLAASAADPSDPATPVPAPAYRSAFADLPTGVVQDALDWTKANESVGEFPRGHIDLLRWEEARRRARAAPDLAPDPSPALPPPPRAPQGSAR